MTTIATPPDSVLREHPFLRDLPEPAFRTLLGCGRATKWKAGEFLFREGEPAASLFLIRGGRVSIEIHVPGKGSVQVESAGEDDVIGWSWLFPPYTRQADGRAIEPVEAMVFDGAALREKMADDPRLGYAIAMRIVHDMHQRLDWMRMQWLDLYGAEK